MGNCWSIRRYRPSEKESSAKYSSPVRYTTRLQYLASRKDLSDGLSTKDLPSTSTSKDPSNLTSTNELPYDFEATASTASEMLSESHQRSSSRVLYSPSDKKRRHYRHTFHSPNYYSIGMSLEDKVELLLEISPKILHPMVIDACRSICDDILNLDGVVDVCPSFYRKETLVFLIYKYTEKNEIVLPQGYTRLCIVFKNVDCHNDENDRVVSNADYLNTDLTSSESDEMSMLLMDNFQRMFESHSNLVSITASSVKSRNFGKSIHEIVKTPCFVLFVPAKGYIPLNENEFPKQIGKYPTDIREGTFKLYGSNHCAQDYHPTLRMGCAISGPGKDKGTLGVFVDQNEKLYFITSAHVLLFDTNYTDLKTYGFFQGGLNGIHNDVVYQPDVDTCIHVNTCGPVGRIAKAIYRVGDLEHAGVEAVLVELTDPKRFPKEGTFPEGDFMDTGFSDASPMKFTSGKIVDQRQPMLSRTEVFKYGSETGITRGFFKLSGPCVHREVFNDGKEVVLLNQLQILGTSECPFAAPGDSGALVLVPHEGNDKDLRALGIVTGGIGQNVCCVTPIWDVLWAFESKLRLKLNMKQF